MTGFPALAQVCPLLRLKAHEDGLHGLSKVKAHPLAFAVANLFFCGYCDRLIRGANGTFFLDLFAASTLVVTGMLYASLFIRHSREVLEKAELLPVGRAAKFLFAWWDIARRPMFISLYLTDAVFFAIIFHAVTPALLLLLLIVTVQLVLAALFAAVPKESAFGVLFAVLVAAQAALAASTLFGIDLVGSGIPLAGWIGDGIRSARGGYPEGLAMAFAKFVACDCIALWFGLAGFGSRR